MQEDLVLRVNKHDIILIVSTIIFAVLLMVLFNLYLYKGVATGVEIHYDGKLLESYSFDKLPKEKTLEIISEAEKKADEILLSAEKKAKEEASKIKESLSEKLSDASSFIINQII